MHIDARFLPLSMRYVLTYVTPTVNAYDSQSTRDTPSIQRVILQATRFELCRNQVEVSYFQLREDS